MSEEIKCPVCGGNKLIVGADPSQRKCAYCGAVVQTEPNQEKKSSEAQTPANTVVQVTVQQTPQSTQQYTPQYTQSTKSKTTAGMLAIFLGGLGIHKFYLGKNGQGIAYLLLFWLFCWTVFVPVLITIIAFIEGIILLTMNDNEFHQKYG